MHVVARVNFLVKTAHLVKKSGVYNYQGCKIPLPSNFNFEFLQKELAQYHNKQVIKFLKYGFPVDCKVKGVDPGIPNYDKGATEFGAQVKSLLQKEVKLGGFLGPFEKPPFTEPRYSPLNSVPKKDSQDRGLILDLSYPPGNSINDGIDKDWYLGVYDKLQLPSLDQLVERVMAL